MKIFNEILAWLTFSKQFREADYIALAIFTWAMVASLIYCLVQITYYINTLTY